MGSVPRMASRVKNFFLGDPLHNEESRHQRLSNPIALAVFSSDAISSVAYATGEIVLVLALAGSTYLHLAWPISAAIAVLLVIVAISYRQTIRAYPGGGGSYIVAKENLGDTAGLIAGASLLVDYVLTVAVSISAGTAAITSAFPKLVPFRVEIALALILLLAVGNLRGVKESGAVFSVPTFLFIGMIGLTIVYGLFLYFTKGAVAIQIPPSDEPIVAVQGLTIFLVLKAFASGCTAMTGVEAIANGVQAFREPASKNAAKTLGWMAGILLFLFLGISFLAVAAGVQPTEETVISQLTRQLFGTSLLYYVISFATMGILVVAANTSYADFPRLSSFMATDDYLPHQLKDRGYRLVHSNGILLLTVAAAILVVAFQGQVSALIPLYALGVFLCFTLSQAGMVIHWFRYKESDPRWRSAAVINAVGAVVTGVVFTVIAFSKFRDGGWVVVVLVPVMIAYFAWVKRRYDFVRAELALPESELVDLNWQSYNRMHNHVVVLVKGIDRRLVRALQYAKTLRADSTEAVFVDISGEEADSIRATWEKGGFGIKLTVIPSPYREVIAPVLDYIRAVPRPNKDHIVTVIVPEYAPSNAADAMLHDQTSFWIKQQLFGEQGVIVADVPYHPSFDDEVQVPTQ